MNNHYHCYNQYCCDGGGGEGDCDKHGHYNQYYNHPYYHAHYYYNRHDYRDPYYQQGKRSTLLEK